MLNMTSERSAAAAVTETPSEGRLARSVKRLDRLLTRPRNLAIASVLIALIGSSAGFAMVYGPDASQVRILEEYVPSLQVILYDDAGEVFGELEALQRRKLVPYQEIPEQLRNALLATEDSVACWLNRWMVLYKSFVRVETLSRHCAGTMGKSVSAHFLKLGS